MNEEESSQENEIDENNIKQSITLNLPNQIILNQDIEKNLIENYNFDALFDENITKNEIYITSSKSIIDKVLNGYNGAIICYGQTGMGKSFTINGMIEQIGKQIFDEIESKADVNNLFKV